MATTFVEVTPEEADKLYDAGLLWSRFLSRQWHHEPLPRHPFMEGEWHHEPLPRHPFMEGDPRWAYVKPSEWGTNWKFAIQVEE